LGFSRKGAPDGVRWLILAGLLTVAAPAAAQVDNGPPAAVDTVEVAPRDTVTVPIGEPREAAADTLEVDLEALTTARPARPVTTLPAARAGAGLTGVPARQPVFGTGALLTPIPGTFTYSLGVPGAPEGVALGLGRPNDVPIRVDGRAADDIFTGRPALERLATDMLAPLHFAPGAFGHPDAVETGLRAYLAEVPLTELRYRAGPDGHQFIGATHAQTRRPDFVQRLGGDQARLSWLLHVGGHRADGEFTNARVDGWGLLARAQVSLPGLALGVTQRHHRREEGAWGGVDPQAPSFYSPTAPVVRSVGQRVVIQNDLAVDAAFGVGPQAPPLSVSAYWTAATLRLEGFDVVESVGDRLGVTVAQRLRLNGHDLGIRVDGRGGRVMGGTGLPAGAMPFELHAELEDRFHLGGADLVLAAGYHASAGWSFPSARVRIGAPLGPITAHAEAYAGGTRPSPAEIFGFGDAIVSDIAGAEQMVGGRAGLEMEIGDITLSLNGDFRRESSVRALLIAGEGPSQFVTLDGSVERAMGTISVGFRETAMRGLYAQTWVAAQAVLNLDATALHRREHEAMPELWAFGRLGFRARGLFEGALDVDLFARGRAWSAFRGRTVEPATGLMGLPPADTPVVPSSGVLDAVLEAGLGGGRAVVFLAYENALSGAAYPGVFVVPVYPLAQPRLRVGLFWVLPD